MVKYHLANSAPRWSFCILLLLAVFLLPAQNQRKIDSLETRAAQEKEDSNRVFFYYSIAQEWSLFNSAKSMEYFNKGRDLSLKINFPRGAAGFYIRRARMIEGRGLFDSARVLYDSAMQIYEVAKLTKSYYSLCINVGNTYYIQGLYEKALPWYLKAAEGSEKNNDPNITSQAYMNIGNIYYEQNKLAEAKTHYNKAIPFAERAENNNTLGSLWNNLGALEFEEKNYEAALVYFQKGLEIRTQSLDGLEGAALCHSNIAECYFLLGDKEKASVHYKEANDRFAAIPDSLAMAENMISWGSARYTWGEKAEGFELMKRGLFIAETVGDLSAMKLGNEKLSAAYKLEKDFVNAHFHLEKFAELKDSINAQESSQLLVEMQTRYDVDQKEKENQLLRQDASLKAIEEESFRKSIWGIVIILLIGAAGLGVTIVVKQRSNKALAAKNAQIEEQKKEITDSINYAQRIQQAILPPQNALREYFPESFVLYMPKAIVSGDFWWLNEKQQYVFVAAADCTGHGVPGAFMSMLGMEILNDVSRETNEPSEILSRLSDGIKRALRQGSGEMQTNDGMDICLCRFNRETNELVYAGANRPLWIRSSSGAMQEYPPTKSPIGGPAADDQVFVSHVIPLTSGAQIYLFTDGFADQFGGEKGKKLKTSGLRKLLEIQVSENALSQEKELSDFFSEWRGSLEQVDDVLVVGIRV
ncbi:MAG TPA: tetratricopeptide repeat protein [Bacteroidia bacterium]|nr:tetratricopeptide repeat protein [Bacteroidia bacterium]